MRVGMNEHHKLYAKLTILAIFLILVAFTIYQQLFLISLLIAPYLVTVIPIRIIDEITPKSSKYFHRIKVILIFCPIIPTILFFVLLTILRYTIRHGLGEFPQSEIVASSFAFLFYYILDFVGFIIYKIFSKIYKALSINNLV